MSSSKAPTAAALPLLRKALKLRLRTRPIASSAACSPVTVCQEQRRELRLLHGLSSLNRMYASPHGSAAATTARASKFAACHTPPVNVSMPTLTRTDVDLMLFVRHTIPTT